MYEFLDALRTQWRRAGGTIDPQIVTTLLRRRRGYDPLNRLAPRERELVALMAAGTSSAGRGD